jgi:D-3-phosphoglycerate dehydrogenase / 2-oxoglutarate reductase
MEFKVVTEEVDYRILVADRIAQEGIDLLRQELPEAQIDVATGLKPEQLRARMGVYTALIVRSETQVTADILAAAPRLKIVGRAGVGVDNIDIETATRQGIMVVNSPTGNIIAAAEHTIAMLMALARHIPAANSSMKAGKWEKSRFLGSEVRNKTLGIIGLGKVGKEVASRARGWKCRCSPLTHMSRRNMPASLASACWVWTNCCNRPIS